MSGRKSNPEEVREIITFVGKQMKADLDAGAESIDPILALEAAYSTDMSKWPPDAITAFLAMQLAVLPDGPPLHKTPRDRVVPTLRKAYRMVGPE